MRKEITYGSRIRELRVQRAWTQEQLTEVAGLQSVRTVQRVEKNETQGAETLQAIAAAFDTDVGALRTIRAIPESRLIGTWSVANNRQFVTVEEMHHWQMCYRSVLAPLSEEEHEQTEELLKRIFSDRECIDRLDAELWDSYIQQTQEPLRSLFALELTIFILGERRDLLLPTLGDLKPISDHIPDWLVQYFMVVPKYGCFRLGPAESLHRFNEGCSAAGVALFSAVKHKSVGAHVYDNALWAAVEPGGENSVRWCDRCFPVLPGGARITFEYIEQVTGCNRAQLHALCDAITGQPFIEGLE